MRKLLDLNNGETLELGMFPSLSANQPQLWRDGFNVEFRERAAWKATGWVQQGTTSSPIYAMAQAYADNGQRIYWAQQDRLYMYFGGVEVLLGDDYSGLGYWSLEPYGNWLLATNDEDPPQVWKGDSAFQAVDLGGVQVDKFRLIKKHKNHIMGYYGREVAWSSDSNPELWLADDDNSAGSQPLRDLDSDIIAACPIGPHFAVYSGDKMTLQQYSGEPFFFTFNPAIEGIGAVSDSGIIPVANKNYGMGKKGFFVTDGIGADYIDTPAIKAWWKARFNSAEGRRVVGLHDEDNETVKWWFPNIAGGISGLSFHYGKGAWSILDQHITAAIPLEVFDSGIVGTGSSWGFLQGGNAGPEAQTSQLETFPLDAAERERYKLWDMYRADGSLEGLEVRFGFSDSPDGAIDWTDWEALVYENYINRESVYLRIALRSQGLGDIWKLSGFSIHGEVTGYL